MASLKVIVDENPAGRLINENDEFIFSYDTESQDKFVSLTMPVRQKPYVHKKLHPLFEMHLPEGYLLSIIKKHFAKITKMDDFGLLKVMAPSIHGRVTYENKKQTIKDNLSLDELIKPKNEHLFDELVSRFALHSALSGVQPKVLAVVEDKATLKCEEYIVKSWGDEYKELAINEYYCMQIVRLSGVVVPEFYISDDEKLLIMKRFDKQEDKHLGFEDMCVLMGKQREDKYEGSYEQIAKVIQTFVSPNHKKSSMLHFFKMIYISYKLENGDAHLKNFGLLYDGVDNIRLAPAYDVVCTTVYIKNDIPALLLLGSKKWWDEKYLIKFGMQSCGLSKKEVDDALKECKSAFETVEKQISQRLEVENNEDKVKVLERLKKHCNIVS
ncbi:MAG TPA: type II toxin-antitoxin system HipA family toxin [Sulfurovum sp.]|nr:MAG: phosphatidylinositol kinase [Sulfurovum sp. 35-42-20]OYZ26592.1 MAG: phosphatidylinositol kinase [Sulfurovum sp. 16-42-52]OYZ50679.1 MAG: phosphatidylinositol kinase [Sulfurovum sp. 24-42-9]OZA47125.1 MAG: phosphatidylinositol kinase [Sulfurovum sp. 17-42-90]OZA61325.1 MAG: phosphatidylinositol kinase [Sulfurovum sp. 39-42-12]HQR74196.1 type II toxin-antitoxin system HipA family toxin [Sulfurovum sp.]